LSDPARSEADSHDSARRYGATAGLLTAVVALAGVLTYGFFVLASHALDADDYGALVVLWSGVFIVVSVIFRPVELLLSRTISEQIERDQEIAPTLRTAGAIQLACGLLVVGLALGFRGPIKDELLEGRGTLYGLMLGAILAYSGSYFGRGLLAGQHRFGLFAALLLIESTGRLLFAVILAAGIADGVDVVALGVFAGPALSLSVIPFALARRHPVAAPPADAGDSVLTLGKGAALAGSLFVALLGEQVLLTTGALFVRADEGTAAAGFMFNIMLVARAPALLFQAVAASLLPHLTRLRSSGEETGYEAFRLSVRLTLLVVAGFGLVLTAGVLALGPRVMEIAFGDKFDYDRLGLAYVAVGLGFYLAAQTLNQAAIARGRARAAAACWVTPALAFVIWNLAGPLEAFRRAEIGFTGAAVLLLASLAVLYARDGAWHGAAPAHGEPGLTAADEYP
jgi:O-antigen/teichoic acid export membrane protein